ncbi:MAG: hypothetical protein ACYDAO_08005 [Thermoplasmataceae archaeon]
MKLLIDLFSKVKFNFRALIYYYTGNNENNGIKYNVMVVKDRKS